MIPDGQSNIALPRGISLRSELCLRSLHLASKYKYLHERTDGQVPSIIFGRNEKGHHGNFHPDSYRMICTKANWTKRLDKVHTASKRMKPRSNWQWKELDCSTSSDALLMNIFCYPGVMERQELRSLLGTEDHVEPDFGFKPRVPLQCGKTDQTEVDMRIGQLLVESKLTESDFQSAGPNLVSRYRDLETVFVRSELPMVKGRYGGYQLIRSTIAAYALGYSFCLFCDARRPELIEDWYKILSAVRSSEVRCKLKLLTWQELASALSSKLQDFLALKYGIVGQ